MPGRLGPRFLIEALFLILLAAGVAYAELDAKWIALVMAAGWLVVALLELTAERIWASAPPWRRPNYYAAVAAPPEPVAPTPAPPAQVEPEPEPTPEPAAEAATVIAPPVQTPAPRAEPTPVEPEPPAEPEEKPDAERDEPMRPRLEPLEPTTKRRWFRRRERGEPQQIPAPELPKHVRLLPAAPVDGRAADEVAQIFDAPEREERTGR